MLRAIASTKSPRIRHSDESSPFPPSLQISLRQIFVNWPGETNWLPLNSRWRTNIRARDELRPCREKISCILRCAPGPLRFVTWTLYFLLSSPFLFFFFFSFLNLLPPFSSARPGEKKSRTEIVNRVRY